MYIPGGNSPWLKKADNKNFILATLNSVPFVLELGVGVFLACM